MRLNRRAPTALALALVAVLAGCTGTAAPAVGRPATTRPAVAVSPTPGAPGLNDPIVPLAGNGGYDVSHYDLNLRYDPPSRQLTGTATITATTTLALSRFDLDLRALTVSAVTVNGVPAKSTVDGEELVVTPATALPTGASFVTVVRYHGVPKAYQDSRLGTGGFLSTSDGAVAVGEPQGAASWFPVNDHPRDKATYTITIAAPDELAALANGILTTRTTAAGWTTWTWTESAPMAPYLATVVIGRYRVHQSTAAGRPVVTAVASTLPTHVDDLLARTPEVVDYLAAHFGPYPFDATGGITIDDNRVQYALENQTRPVYAAGFFNGDGRAMETLAHELAHQWFGDDVSVDSWSDIWLNEGFATYAQWLWRADHGGGSLQTTFDSFYGQPAGAPLWPKPPGAPTVDQLFGRSVYVRGAMTLIALRTAVGPDTFDRILRIWVQQHAGKTGTTAEFEALAKQISGKPLDRLFQDWLFGTTLPPRPAPL